MKIYFSAVLFPVFIVSQLNASQPIVTIDPTLAAKIDATLDLLSKQAAQQRQRFAHVMQATDQRANDSDKLLQTWKKAHADSRKQLKIHQRKYESFKKTQRQLIVGFQTKILAFKKQNDKLKEENNKTRADNENMQRQQASVEKSQRQQIVECQAKILALNQHNEQLKTEYNKVVADNRLMQLATKKSRVKNDQLATENRLVMADNGALLRRIDALRRIAPSTCDLPLAERNIIFAPQLAEIKRFREQQRIEARLNASKQAESDKAKMSLPTELDKSDQNGILDGIPGLIKDNISQKNRALTCRGKIVLGSRPAGDHRFDQSDDTADNPVRPSRMKTSRTLPARCTLSPKLDENEKHFEATQDLSHIDYKYQTNCKRAPSDKALDVFEDAMKQRMRQNPDFFYREQNHSFDTSKEKCVEQNELKQFGEPIYSKTSQTTLKSIMKVKPNKPMASKRVTFPTSLPLGGYKSTIDDMLAQVDNPSAVSVAAVKSLASECPELERTKIFAHFGMRYVKEQKAGVRLNKKLAKSNKIFAIKFKKKGKKTHKKKLKAQRKMVLRSSTSKRARSISLPFYPALFNVQRDHVICMSPAKFNSDVQPLPVSNSYDAIGEDPE